MPWYFYASMIMLAVLGTCLSPLVIHFAWEWFWPEKAEPTEAYHVRFDDGDMQVREHADGSTTMHWSD